MRITVESTTQIVEVDGVLARVWDGATERGTRVQCCITRIAVEKFADHAEFEAELIESPDTRPVEPRAYSERMIL